MLEKDSFHAKAMKIQERISQENNTDSRTVIQLQKT